MKTPEKQTSHTPKPWVIAGSYPLVPFAEVFADGFRYQICAEANDADLDAEAQANANLISVAPELLEGLRLAASILHDIAKEDLNDVEEVTSNTADKFDALIAKATGGAR